MKFIVIVFAILLALFPRFVIWYYKVSIKNPLSEYDFIIVGAGTSGSVVASRLSEDPNVKVLLVEAGGEDVLNYQISIPLLSSLNKFTDVDWKYETEPQNFLYKQNVPWPRGKILGGSSAINAMMYVKGSKDDFDAWEKLGAVNWSHADVEPYFKKVEDTTAMNFSNKMRGSSGPLKLSFPYIAPITHAFVNAGMELGYPSGDYNSDTIEGFHYIQSTVARGRRQTASVAYLHPVINERKNNLHIMTYSHVNKILLESDDEGNVRAAGIAFVQNDVEHRVKTRKEIILSGGSVGTPQLLLLSGIGPRDHLEQIKIKTAVDLPGVGQNLQDHIGLSVCWLADNSQPGDVIEGYNSISIKNLLTYFLFDGAGPLGSNSGSEAHALLRTKFAVDKRPDLQFIIDSTTWDKLKQPDENKNRIKTAYDKRRETFAKINQRKYDCDFTITNVALRTGSVGQIKLRSKKFRKSPIIDPNYLSVKNDIEILVEGFRIMEKLEETETFKKLGVKMNLLFEECEDQIKPRSRKCFEEVIKQTGRTLYHAVGVAKIGPKDDPMSVVNSRLQVYGVDGLRVADASVMPEIPSANTQAACYMIGEKAADMIKEDWKLK